MLCLHVSPVLLGDSVIPHTEARVRNCSGIALLRRGRARVWRQVCLTQKHVLLTSKLHCSFCLECWAKPNTLILALFKKSLWCFFPTVSLQFESSVFYCLMQRNNTSPFSSLVLPRGAWPATGTGSSCAALRGFSFFWQWRSQWDSPGHISGAVIVCFFGTAEIFV